MARFSFKEICIDSVTNENFTNSADRCRDKHKKAIDSSSQVLSNIYLFFSA